jgi:hypothetical protein
MTGQDRTGQTDDIGLIGLTDMAADSGAAAAAAAAALSKPPAALRYGATSDLSEVISSQSRGMAAHLHAGPGW